MALSKYDKELYRSVDRKSIGSSSPYKSKNFVEINKDVTLGINMRSTQRLRRALKENKNLWA